MGDNAGFEAGDDTGYEAGDNAKYVAGDDARFDAGDVASDNADEEAGPSWPMKALGGLTNQTTNIQPLIDMLWCV